MLSDKEYTQSVINMRMRAEKLSREGDYWTEEEQKRLEKMYNGGTGLTEIAMILQRTESAVCQQIERQDLLQRAAHPRRGPGGGRHCKCRCETCGVAPGKCPWHLSYRKRKEGRDV